MSFPDDVPLLTDGGVTLRAHRPGDAQAALEQCTDPLSQKWTTVPVPYTRAHAEGVLTEIVPAGWADGRWAFAVEALDAGTPRFCGTVELRLQADGRAEVAYGAHPWARGRGTMRRALTLLLDWGFDVQSLRTVVWWANVGNWASRRTAWRLGFSFTGTVRGYLPQRGELLDGWVGTVHRGAPRSPRTPWLTVPVLEGGQVRLRPFTGHDVPRIVEACSDERTAHWVSQVPHPYTADDARAWLEDRREHLATGSAVTWAVADLRTDQCLGAVNAFAIVPRREAEAGYWVHPDARGRGVATEACGLALDHCFAPYDGGGLGLGRVRIRSAEGNHASREVISRCGFTPVGRERRALLLGDGSLVDVLGYDLLREERA
jgi:RimJ/RimL family protein N-acetyltransferase